jgi:hypothetical protein
MALTVAHLLKTVATLEHALFALNKTSREDEILYDLYRNATLKVLNFLWRRRVNYCEKL